MIEFWGSLGVVAVLSLVHLTIRHWPMLRGPYAHVWLSISAGTALAYVFAHLLPELAHTQAELTGPTEPTYTFLRNHVYLLALAGLLTYFALLSTIEESSHSQDTRRGYTYAIALQTGGYSIYSFQLGHLATEFASPGAGSYLLATLVLGLHLMGVDFHLHRTHPAAYQRIMRFAYAVALVAGWGGGMTTGTLDAAVTYSSPFVAGGIIITAIREELPGRGQPKPIAFFIAAVVACAVILTVQYWQII